MLQRKNLVYSVKFHVNDRETAGPAGSVRGQRLGDPGLGLAMKIVSKIMVLLAAMVLAGTVSGVARAQDGLTIVRSAEAGGAAELFLSLDDLRALPQVTLETVNDYKDGINAYTGPLVRDVLALIGRGTGTRAKLTAANDYSVEIDLREFDDWDVIFALEMNGEPFSLRDLGPIWVMYPLTGNEELQDPVYNSRLIWQLVHLEIL